LIVVIGSGVAGLSAALSLARARYDVKVITKSVTGGSTPIAKGGIAVPVGRDDSPEIHAQDTLKAGAGLCDEGAVRYFTHQAVKVYYQLQEMGFKFDPELWLEGGHSRRRIAHRTDETGAQLHRFLYHRAVEMDVKIVEAQLISLKASNGRVKGVITDKGEIEAEKVVLATGGYNSTFKFATSKGNLGEGIASAFLAGAAVADMEFVQFHPTVTEDGFLMTEALRGEGAKLINDKGERFAFAYDQRGELAPRDVLARAVYTEYLKGNEVFLDLSDVRELDKRFPVVSDYLKKRGLGTRVKIVTAAHFTMGGVLTNVKGQTTLENLFAIGEAADTGLHGANRLASNSLLEGLVMGLNISEFIEDDWTGPKLKGNDLIEIEVRRAEGLDLDSVKEGNWRHLGVIREGKSLEEWLNVLKDRHGNAWSLVSYLATYSALMRRESRGSHYRSDYPRQDDSFRKRFVLVRKGSV
jgi:L-aspartate oxidase